MCGECKRRFTTYEKLGPIDIKVQKRGDRDAEPFDHHKLVQVMERVCRGRPIGPDAIERVARRIEADLLDERRHTIHSWELAGLVLTRLRDLDAVAYSRFAADYLDDAGNLRVQPRHPGDAVAPQLGLFEGDSDD